MKKNLSIFFIKLLVYSIIIFLLYFLTKTRIPQKFYFEKTHYLILFFFLITLVFHFGLIRSSSKGNRNIITYYMTATALKFILFLAAIIVYSLLNRGKSTAFVSNFFVLYVLYTIFEVSTIYFQFRIKPGTTEDSS